MTLTKSRESDQKHNKRVFLASGEPLEGVVIVDKNGDQTGTPLTPLTVSTAAGLFSIDAFARQRMSQPITIFDSKQLHDNSPLSWDDQEVSGGSTTSTHSANKASTTMGVALNTAGRRVRQTFRCFNYQPGKSQLVFLTGTLGLSGGGTGITRYMGYFEDSNGIYFKDNEGTNQVGIRSNATGSVVDNVVSQDSWNVDGLGHASNSLNPSGVTMDITDKSQIGFIDFEWLGVGTVGIGFVINRIPYYVHFFHHANILSGVYMSSPNLPLRYEIENDGTGAASTLEHICGTVISEGGQQEIGVDRNSSTDNTQVTCATVGVLYAIKGIRLKSNHLDDTVKVLKVALSLQSASDDIEWVLMFDPTIAGSPTWNAETNSAVESFTGATANTITNGSRMDAGYVSTRSGQNASGGSSSNITNALLLGSSIAKTPTTIVLCAKSLTSVNAIVEGGITWKELT